MINAGISLSERQLAALLLIASMVIFIPGGILFTGRALLKWPVGQTTAFARWERGLVVAAALVMGLGFVLLDDVLRAAGDPLISRLALAALLVAVAVLTVAELTWLHNREWVYPQVVFYVVIACLAQAAFGLALLQTSLVPAWVGWAALVWNLAWLALMAVISRGNMYFPAAHHLAPLLIGIALLIAW